MAGTGATGCGQKRKKMAVLHKRCNDVGVRQQRAQGGGGGGHCGVLFLRRIHATPRQHELHRGALVVLHRAEQGPQPRALELAGAPASVEGGLRTPGVGHRGIRRKCGPAPGRIAHRPTGGGKRGGGGPQAQIPTASQKHRQAGGGRETLCKLAVQHGLRLMVSAGKKTAPSPHAMPATGRKLLLQSLKKMGRSGKATTGGNGPRPGAGGGGRRPPPGSTSSTCKNRWFFNANANCCISVRAEG